MSIDVGMRIKTATGTYYPVSEPINITGNLHTMFYHALGTDIDNLTGRTGEDVKIILYGALDQLSTRTDHFRQFEASNGWGTVSQAMSFLNQFAQLCRQYPDAEVDVW
jgi:hypothetical protein